MEYRARTSGRFIRWIGLAGIGVLICTGLNAQRVNVQGDSLKTWLCKKWEVNYALMGAVRIDRAAGTPNLIYEFRPDNTYVMIQGGPKDTVNGKWSFDQKKKLIRLLAKGQAPSRIISLLPGELILVVDKKKPVPANEEEIKMVLNIKRD
jgi:hypothetical protein